MLSKNFHIKAYSLWAICFIVYFSPSIVMNILNKKGFRNFLLYKYLIFIIIPMLIADNLPLLKNIQETGLGTKLLIAFYFLLIGYFIFFVRHYGYKKLRKCTEYGGYSYNLKIFEIAGSSIKSIEDGFTERPYPTGKIDASKEEIISFVNSIDRLFIAYSFLEKDKALIVFGHGLFEVFPFLKPNLQKSTYVEFDWEGNMSVHIAKRDYEKYKEELTFDQLCRALGELVLKFFELYKEGKEKKILEMLKGGK
jgi:hypothetical protein